MKKGLVILALLVVIVAAGAWFFSNRYGRADGASLVGSTAVAYIALPDLLRTSERWPNTALAKIGADPQVTAFLEKPLELMAGGGGEEASDIIDRLKPGRIFLAVESISAESVEGFVGFQYFGTRGDLDAAMERLHAELLSAFPGAEKTTSDHEGEVVTSIVTPNGTLFTASLGSWGFLANSLTTLETALNRAADRDKTPTLAAAPEFTAVLKELPADADFIWFVRPAPIFDLVAGMAEETDSALNESQMAELRTIQGAGGTLTFDGLDQRENIFVYSPGADKVPTLNRGTINLTTPETAIFLETAQNWSMVADPDYLQTLPPEVTEFLQASQIDLAQLPVMFGGDAALMASWPQNAMIPSALAAVEIKDRAAIEALMERLAGSFGIELPASDAAGARIIPLPAMEIQLIDPVVAITDTHIFLALTRAELNSTLDRAADAPTLKTAPQFAAAGEAYQATAQAFGYIDSRTIFERIYNQVRPILIFSVSMMPEIAANIDVSKLPETEAIAQYLRPIVFSQRQTDEGWLLESTGPITLYQGMGGIGLGVGAAALAEMMGGEE